MVKKPQHLYILLLDKQQTAHHVANSRHRPAAAGTLDGGMMYVPGSGQ
jgi:hypothetical protein